MSYLNDSAIEYRARQAAADAAYRELVLEVRAAVRAGVTHTEIWRATGMSRMTIRKHCTDLGRDPEIEEIAEIPTV